MRSMQVSEIFGPTIQGEGVHQGQAVVFVRLGLCNLDCAWCDTPYTWDFTGKNGVAYDRLSEMRTMTVGEVADRVRAIAGQVRRVVVSGGEPMVHSAALVDLVSALADFAIEVETNGTVMIPSGMPLRVTFNVSPKLAGSGVALGKRYRPGVLSAFVGWDRATFKFVVTNLDDVLEAQAMVDELGVEPHRVFLMPEGTSAAKIMRALPSVFQIAAERGWGVSPRLHVLAFDDKRGV